MKTALHPIERKINHGFTLIEIMVVLVVVGLLVTLVGLNLGGGGERRELEEVSRTLYLKMQNAAEEAVITNREIGVRFEDGRYRFLEWQPQEDNWVTLPGRGYRSTSLPEWVEYEIETDTGGGRELGGEDDDDELPDLVFFSSGESTPFDLYLWWEQDRDATHLITSDGIESPQWLQPSDDNGASGRRR